MIEDKHGQTIVEGSRVLFPYGGDLHIAVVTSLDQPDYGPPMIHAAVMATAPAGLCQVISDDQQPEVPPPGQTTVVGGIAP